MNRQGSHAPGFTIIEVMITVAVAGLMLSSLFVYVNSLMTQARVSHERLTDVFILEEKASEQTFEELFKKQKEHGTQQNVSVEEFAPVRGSALKSVAQLMLYKYTIESFPRPESLISIRFKEQEKKVEPKK